MDMNYSIVIKLVMMIDTFAGFFLIIAFWNFVNQIRVKNKLWLALVTANEQGF